MPFSELLWEGLRLMALGMGIVFGFLVLLVFVMFGVSRLAKAVGDDAPLPELAAAPLGASAPGDDELIAVISAAIARHRATGAGVVDSMRPPEKG